MEKNILYQFINNIPQVIWWKDLNFTFLGCNDNLLEFLGLKNKKEIIGKTDYDLFSQEEADFFRKIDEEIILTGKPQLNFEEPMTLPGQGKRWLSTSKVPLYDDDNKIIGTIGWFNDITAFKQMQIKIDEKNKALFDYSFQLEQANRDLELVNIDLEHFTYAASHDLKEPIRTMKGFASLLKVRESDRLKEESKEYIDFICNSANRMETLIDSILNYARTGTKELVVEYVDVNDIISDKMIDLKQVIKSKSVVVNLNIPPTKIHCYPRLIGLVFYNLINNGIKFNVSSIPTIDCNCSENDDYWVFSIEDNGIGIESKYAKQIFEPFKRLVGENYEGSGIGLSICKRVVTLHKGDIWIEEGQNGGAIFKFSISKNLKVN